MCTETKYGTCKRPIMPGEYETHTGEDWVKFQSRMNAHWGWLRDNGRIFADVEEERAWEVRDDYPIFSMPSMYTSKVCEAEGCTNKLLRGSAKSKKYCDSYECVKKRTLKRYHDKKEQHAV